MREIKTIHFITGTGIIALLVYLAVTFLTDAGVYTRTYSGLFTWAALIFGFAVYRKFTISYAPKIVQWQDHRQEEKEVKSSFDKRLDRAIKYQLDGEFDKAIDEYEELVKFENNPEPEASAMKVAQLFERTYMDKDKARYWYHKAIALACMERACSDNPYAINSNKSLERISTEEP